MNYRHAFHAGNHADVLKHTALLACLDHLGTKPAPFAVLDIHAGTGRYDLAGPEAQRSPEWREGAARIFEWAEAPFPVTLLQRALHEANPSGGLRFYPGSPLLTRAALRGGDRLIACELHDEDAAALKALFRNDRQAQIHHRDGWTGLRGLLPFAERRGLVLVDPPYEQPHEIIRAAREIGAALARFPGGVFLWWRPLKDDGVVDAADAELRAQASALSAPASLLRVDLAVAERSAGLAASSLMVVRAPYGLADMLRAAMPPLAARLARDGGRSGWRVA